MGSSVTWLVSENSQTPSLAAQILVESSAGGGDGQELNFRFFFSFLLVPQAFKSLKVFLNQPPSTFQPLLVLNCVFCILANPMRNVVKTARLALTHKSLRARQG